MWISHTEGICEFMNLTPFTVQRTTDGLTVIIKSYVSDLSETYVFDVLFKESTNDPRGVAKRHEDQQEGGRTGGIRSHNVQGGGYECEGLADVAARAAVRVSDNGNTQSRVCVFLYTSPGAGLPAVSRVRQIGVHGSNRDSSGNGSGHDFEGRFEKREEDGKKTPADIR